MPSYVFTEDYQVDFMRQYHAVFDVFRKKYLAGEMVWNFADFMTVQSQYTYKLLSLYICPVGFRGL